MSRRPAKNIASRSNYATIWIAALFSLFGIFSVYFQIFQFVNSNQFGFPIPDTILYSRTLTYWQASVPWYDKNNYMPGLTLLYGWAWRFNPILSVLINFLTLLLALLTCQRLFINRMNFSAIYPALTLINVYLVLALPGPNKEIPLLALTILFSFLLYDRPTKYILISSLLGLIAFTFRDGFGVFLTAFAFSFFVTKIEKIRTVAFFALSLIFASFQSLAVNVSGVFSRNAEVVEKITSKHDAVGGIAAQMGISSDNPASAAFAYVVRVIYNWAYLGLNPVLFTPAGDPYILGWAYWLFGLAIMASIPAAVWTLFKSQNRPALFCASLALSTLAVISISLYVQPRYLMPVLPMALAALFQAPTYIRRNAFAGTAVFVMAFAIAHIATGTTVTATLWSPETPDFYHRQ